MKASLLLFLLGYKHRISLYLKSDSLHFIKLLNTSYINCTASNPKHTASIKLPIIWGKLSTTLTIKYMIIALKGI